MNESSLNSRVLDYLSTCVQKGRLVHAYLFVGPNTLILRNSAESFLRSLLCLESRGSAACACKSCTTSLSAHPDSIIIEPPEGKKFIDISLIRSALERLSVTPWLSSSKVALIDAADTMTEESSNALLKTLEEPPPHSTIVLTASDAEMLPATIVSRSQTLRFPDGEREKSEARPENVEEALRSLDPSTRSERVIDERFKGSAEQGRKELEHLVELWLTLLHDLFSLHLRVSHRMHYPDKSQDLQKLARLYPLPLIVSLLERLRFLQKDLIQNGNPKLLAESFLVSLP